MGLAGCITYTSIPDVQGTSQPITLKIASIGAADQCSNAIGISSAILNNNVASAAASPTGSWIDQDSADGGTSFTDTRYDRGQVYAGQESPDTCYAAALATIWRAAGVRAREGDFIQAIEDTCIDRNRDSANYLQILSSAYYVHEDKRYDLVNVAASPYSLNLGNETVTTIQTAQGSHKIISGTALNSPIPGLFFIKMGAVDQNSAAGRLMNAVTVPLDFHDADPTQGVQWQSWINRGARGGIRPVQSAAELVRALKRGAWLLGGLRNGAFNHVVIIDGVHVDNEGTRLDRVRIIDPANEALTHEWIDIVGGDTIDTFTFIVAIDAI